MTFDASTHVLGVSAFFHDSAAALVQGGTVVAAAQEERFTRKKGDWRYPTAAIEYCLAQLPADAELNAVAFYENPRLKLDRIFRNALENAPRGAPIWPRTLSTVDALNRALPEVLTALVGDGDRVHFTSHHRSHAASAYYPSPFTDAAVLVVDGVGEFSTTSLWRADGRRLEPLAEMRFPDSLGLFYSAFTQYCGFKVNSGEYKLMGLAPFGNPVFQRRILDELIEVKSDGSFSLNMRYFTFDTNVTTINPLFADLFGYPARHEVEPLTSHYMDVAASAQAVTNEVMVRLATTAVGQAGSTNLCMAGGVALNCVANTEIFQHVAGLSDLWIQPAAGDAGGALGAALVAADTLQRDCEAPKQSDGLGDQMAGAYLGPEFSDGHIIADLERAGVQHETPTDEGELCRRVARALASGQIVGHFNGRMEYGPRALGNRSILADPRPSDMLSRANRRIKFREGWRPFAPVVMAEHAEQFFEPPYVSPYMLLVSRLREEYRSGSSLSELRASGMHDLSELGNSGFSVFPAVTHCDYSARLQTVSASVNSRLYNVLTAFRDETDCPLLLNTSFNVRGEPIVCTPADAISCFLNTGIDLLVIGSQIVEKSSQPESLRAREGKMIFDAD